MGRSGTSKKKRTRSSKTARKGTRLGRMLRVVLRKAGLVLLAYFGLCTVCLLLYNVIDPPTTGVQLQRRVASWFEDDAYHKRYNPVAREALSPHVRHAVVAAEDGRFYDHWGIDWQAVRQAFKDNKRPGRVRRGGSTITQQLVKNLFMTTHSTYLRKVLEVPLAYLAEILLSKERILDLYLNVIEWDRGVYGAEAAAQRYYNISAARLSREQAAGLAACIPAPHTRSPQRMNRYTNTILRRMRQMNW